MLPDAWYRVDTFHHDGSYVCFVWGDRYGVVTDPFGHKWAFAMHIKDMTPDEMQAAMKDAFAQMP